MLYTSNNTKQRMNSKKKIINKRFTQEKYLQTNLEETVNI